MVPTQKEIEKLHHKYAPNDLVYDLVYGHGQIVAEIALWCADNVKDQPVDKELLEAASLLHDIGSYVFFDDKGVAHGSRLYKLHASFGAKILADEGLDPRIASLVETHVVMGLTRQEILDGALPLPARDYIPATLEGELLCYADRFHTKLSVFNSFDTNMERFKQELPKQAEKFAKAAEKFGVPDIKALADKWKQPIR